MFNELLTKAFRSRPDFAEVLSTTNVDEAEKIIRSERCTLMVLDIQLPNINGFDFALTAIRLCPKLKILGMSSHGNDYIVHLLANSPLSGFFDKSADVLDEIWIAIERIQRGMSYFSPSIEQLRAKMRTDPHSFNKLLSSREITILEHLSFGRKDSEIGRILKISPETVKWHRKQMMRKLSVSDSSALIVYGREKGLSTFNSKRS